MNRIAAMAAMKLSLFMKQRVNEDFFRTYSRLIAADVTQEEVESCPEEPEALFF